MGSIVYGGIMIFELIAILFSFLTGFLLGERANVDNHIKRIYELCLKKQNKSHRRNKND